MIVLSGIFLSLLALATTQFVYAGAQNGEATAILPPRTQWEMEAVQILRDIPQTRRTKAA